MKKIQPFSQVPFLYITVFFILGILCAQSVVLDIDYLGVMLLFFITILTWTLRKKNNLLRILFMSSSFFFLGVFSWAYALEDVSPVDDQPQSYIVHIDEVSKGKKDWNKVVGRIKGIVKGQDVIDVYVPVLLYVQNEMFLPGDIILTKLKLNKIKNKLNPGEFNTERYWKTKGIQYMAFVESWKVKYLDHIPGNKLIEFSNSIRASILKTIKTQFNTEVSGVISALLLGDKGSLDKNIKSDFSKAGAMHVLAVSGLHVGIVLALLTTFISRFKKWFSKKKALLISILLLWLYAAITGFPLSVVRACFMFTLLSLSLLSNRQNNLLNTLFFSAFVLLLINPKWIFDIGFQLSYMAMLGIFLFQPVLENAIYIHNRWLKKIWDWSVLSVSAQLFTLPFTLVYFHQFPNYFLISNLGMILFSSTLLTMAIVFVVVSKIPILNSIVIFLLGFGVVGMIYFVNFIANLPFSTATGYNLTIFDGGLLLFIILLLFLFRDIRRFKLVASVVVLMTIFYLQLNRIGSMDSNEIIVYSSSNRIISVKNGNSIICFHPEGKKEKASYLIESYSKIAPGNVTFQVWEKGEYLLGNSLMKVKIEHMEKRTVIAVNSDKWNIRSRYDSQRINDGENIDLPFLQSNKESNNLEKGALKICF